MNPFYVRQIYVYCFIGLLCFAPVANGQWVDNSDDLPGTVSKNEIITLVSIGGASLIVPMLIPLPKPEIHLKGNDIGALLNIESDQSPTSKVATLRKYSGPVQISLRYPKTSEYGTIQSFGADHLVLTTETDSLRIKYQSINEIMDLPGAAKRKTTKRFKNTLGLAGLTIMSMYAASMENSGSETVETLYTVLSISCAIGALATIVLPSEEEKEYRNWQNPGMEKAPQPDDEIPDDEILGVASPGKSHDSDPAIANAGRGYQFGINILSTDSGNPGVALVLGYRF